MNDFAPPSRPSRKVLVLSLLGLAGFLAVQALLLRHYVRVDTRPPSWDQATHMEIALDYREALGAGRWGDAWFLAPKPGMPPFPPAYHLLLRGAFDSPDPAHAALWLNWFYMAVLAVSLFGICWRFLPDSRALAATLAFCAAPGLQDLVTTQLVDLAVVAWVAAGYWALLESEGFTGWAASLAFGAVYAVGMMHKWTYFSYMLPAYLIAARALGDRRARLQVLAAAGLSLALFAPWYWSHAALLPSRLMQASTDFSVPFWKDGAWAEYLKQSIGGLGPLLWALGFISMLAPQFTRRREYGWVLAYWVVFSYVFWTLVPNRQLRFLLPGLAPLGLFMAATWPRTLTWGVAAFQLVAMVNFFFGAVGPLTVSMPFVPLTFFVNKPPAREDWKIEEILRRIEAERDPSRPITNVTLVANDAYFNAPTFHWIQRRLELPHARMRGVNKRLCELSEFVLLKSGRLGPEGVIDGLPEAAKAIADPDGWFRQAYEELARWPLPDGSAAVLYRQRRGLPAPILQHRMAYEAFSVGDVKGTGLKVDLGAWDPRVSAWSRARLTADQVTVRGLKVKGVTADLDDLSLTTLSHNDIAEYDWNDMRLMRLDRVKVDGLEIDAADLKAFLESRVPGLELSSLTLDGTVKAAGTLYGRPVSAEAALRLDGPGRRLKVAVLSASYLGTPVPAALFRPIKELNLSLNPNPETPFYIDLPGLTIKDGRLTIP
ncbi:MAG TPA: hypothetical protein VH309_11850 [Elusimicrobiota bacterium]|jgi:hypothetical protein|nr:hypothetical protein [Elusimicrobiota bacterium]